MILTTGLKLYQEYLFLLKMEFPICYGFNEMNANVKALRTKSRHLRIDKQAICIFKFLFEAYEGIAVVETIDSKSGHIAIHVAPGCGSIVDDVLSDLSRQYFIESVN